MSAFTLKWSPELARPEPFEACAFHGETLTLEATPRSYGAPLVGLTGATARLYYQTPGMAENLWYDAPAAYDPATGTLSANWNPALDPGAERILFFLALTDAQGARLLRVYGALRLLPSPGFNPALLTPVDIRQAIVDQIQAELKDWMTPQVETAQAAANQAASASTAAETSATSAAEAATAAETARTAAEQAKDVAEAQAEDAEASAELASSFATAAAAATALKVDKRLTSADNSAYPLVLLQAVGQTRIYTVKGRGSMRMGCDNVLYRLTDNGGTWFYGADTGKFVGACASVFGTTVAHEPSLGNVNCFATGDLLTDGVAVKTVKTATRRILCIDGGTPSPKAYMCRVALGADDPASTFSTLAFRTLSAPPATGVDGLFLGFAAHLTDVGFNPRSGHWILATNVLQRTWADGTSTDTAINGAAALDLVAIDKDLNFVRWDAETEVWVASDTLTADFVQTVSCADPAAALGKGGARSVLAGFARTEGDGDTFANASKAGQDVSGLPGAGCLILAAEQTDATTDGLYYFDNHDAPQPIRTAAGAKLQMGGAIADAAKGLTTRQHLCTMVPGVWPDSNAAGARSLLVYTTLGSITITVSRTAPVPTAAFWGTYTPASIGKATRSAATAVNVIFGHYVSTYAGFGSAAAVVGAGSTTSAAPLNGATGSLLGVIPGASYNDKCYAAKAVGSLFARAGSGFALYGNGSYQQLCGAWRADV